MPIVEYRNIILVMWYLLLGGAVFLVNYTNGSIGLSAVVASLVVASPPIISRIEEWYDSYVERQEIQSEYESHASRFMERMGVFGFHSPDSSQLVQSLVDGDFEPTQTTVYSAGVEMIAGDEPPYRQDILEALILCREIELSDDSIQRARLKAEIDRLTTDFNFLNPDDETLEFLGAFEGSQSAIKHGSSEVDSIYNKTPSDTREVALEFVMNYGTTDELALLLFSDKEQSEELRRTLGKLIARGRLATTSVTKETAEKIQLELEEKGSATTKFLIFSQEIHKEESVAKAIEKFPHFRIGNKYPESGFPETVQYMRIYVVYPEFDYGTAEEFMDAEITPAIPPDYPEDGFIAAMPLELANLEIFPGETEVEEYLEGTYETLTFLKTGSGQDLSEIVSDEAISEIDVSEVLATLPFNVMVDEITEPEKEVIIDHYEDLKEEFGVRELFDWSDVDPEGLGKRLAELDGESNSDRWQELADTIVEKAGEYDAATFGNSVDGQSEG